MDVGDRAEMGGESRYVMVAGDMAGLSQDLVGILRLTPGKKARLDERAGACTRGRELRIGHVARLYEAFHKRVTRA